MYEFSHKLKDRLLEKTGEEFPTLQRWADFHLFRFNSFRWIVLYHSYKWNIVHREWPDNDYAVRYEEVDRAIAGFGDTPKEAYQNCNRLVRASYRIR